MMKHPDAKEFWIYMDRNDDGLKWEVRTEKPVWADAQLEMHLQRKTLMLVIDKVEYYKLAHQLKKTLEELEYLREKVAG